MNARNAIEAFRAAADALERGDSGSALEYTTVAVAEIRRGERINPGHALLYMTADAQACVAAGTIDCHGRR